MDSKVEKIYSELNKVCEDSFNYTSLNVECNKKISILKNQLFTELLKGSKWYIVDADLEYKTIDITTDISFFTKNNMLSKNEICSFDTLKYASDISFLGDKIHLSIKWNKINFIKKIYGIEIISGIKWLNNIFKEKQKQLNDYKKFLNKLKLN